MALPAAFDPIVNAPRPQKLVLGVFVLLIIGAAGYFLLLAPLMTEVDTLRTQNAQLDRDLAQNRAIVADLARFRREATELQARLAVMTERLPSEREMPTVYRAVSDAGSSAGLAVSLFRPEAPQTKDYYNEIPITLNAEGSYHQVGEFFERVARLPRIVNVSVLKLTGLTPGRHSLRAELTLSTYTYRPVGSPPPPKPGTKPPGA